MLQVGQGRPVWMLLQAVAWENWFNPVHRPQMQGQSIDESMIVYPDYAQLRFMAYDAIASGSRGLALGMYRTPTEGQIWKDVCRLVAELRGLHDVLAAPACNRPMTIRYKDLGFSIWDGVRVAVRRMPGCVYVIAVNTAFDPAEVTLTFAEELGNVATVVSEGREMGVERNSLRDSFEPYGTHVYRIAL